MNFLKCNYSKNAQKSKTKEHSPIGYKLNGAIFTLYPGMTQALTHPRIKPLSVLQASLAGKNERLTGMWTLTDRQTTHRGQISLLLVSNKLHHHLLQSYWASCHVRIHFE